LGTNDVSQSAADRSWEEKNMNDALLVPPPVVRSNVEELPNARLKGPFNDLCNELAERPEFQKLTTKNMNLRKKSSKLVVQFLAFYRQGAKGYSKTAGNSMARFIDSEMKYWEGRDLEDFEGDWMKLTFLKALALSNAVFGNDVFRKKPGSKADISDVLFGLVMCGFANRNPAKVLNKADEIKAAFFSLCAKPKFNAAICLATCGHKKVVFRFRAWNRALDDILGPSYISDVGGDEFPELGVVLP
jgi:hypothetical protein